MSILNSTLSMPGCLSFPSLPPLLLERFSTPKQPANPSLVWLLISQTFVGKPGAHGAALWTLRVLAQESNKNRAVISTHETQSALIEIAFNNLDLDLRLEAIGVLAMCSLMDGESVVVVGRPERLRGLVEVMRRHPAMEAWISMVAMVEVVATGERSVEA